MNREDFPELGLPIRAILEVWVGAEVFTSVAPAGLVTAVIDNYLSMMVAASSKRKDRV